MPKEINDMLHEFYGQFIHFLPALFCGCLVFAAFYIAAQIMGVFICRAGEKSRLDKNLVRLFSQSAKITLLLFGGVTALGTLGIQVGALIAGLGLSGFALGLALKDALSNLMAGISIMLYHPFSVGNRVSIGGMEGTVSDIDLRYTTLQASDKTILIPNSNVFTNSIVILK